MYPYAHYKYMLGKVKDQKVLDDLLRIETDRVAGYLEKTKGVYRYRIAHCLGIFREAFIRGAEEEGVTIDLILPTRDVINVIVEQGDCALLEGSLSMDEYHGELCEELIRFRN